MPTELTREQAEALARAAWGKAGFARPCQNQRIVGGQLVADPPHAYQFGYYRRGKKGARLSTVKGQARTGYADAVREALESTRGLRAHDRLTAEIAQRGYLL